MYPQQTDNTAAQQKKSLITSHPEIHHTKLTPALHAQ